MERRNFLRIAAASVLGADVLSGDEKTVPDMTQLTREILIRILDDERWNMRTAADYELRSRGLLEIQEQQKPLEWKKELTPLPTMSLGVRGRLERILFHLSAEEALLLWGGCRMKEIPEYADAESIPMMDYCPLVNASIQGGISIRKIHAARAFGRFKEPVMVPVRPGELFWEYIERNADQVSAWNEKSVVELDNKPEEKILAYDGALCGKLSMDKFGAMIFLVTDPNIAFVAWEVSFIDIIAGGKTITHMHDPERGTLNAIYMEYPEGVAMADIESITMHLRVLGVPVHHMTADDLSVRHQSTLGEFAVDVSPSQPKVGPEGEELHLLRSSIYIPQSQNPAVLYNDPDSFFTVYRELEDGRIGLQYSGAFSGYEPVKSGGEFFLHLDHPPTRVDVHVPDVTYAASVSRTLRYDLKK